MSFKVSRVNQPEIITNSFLPLIQEVGELTKRDIDQILYANSQGSYTTDYRQLGEYVGLWKQVDDHFVYGLDNDKLSSDRIECLFQLLGRLPHFRHWLYLKYCNEQTPGVEDVTILDERNQRFLKERLKMLNKWGKHFENKASMPMTDLIEEHLLSRIRVSDEFLFYDSYQHYTKSAEIRTTLLIFFILAQERGFAIDLNAAANALAVERKDIDRIITDVFSPLAISVDTIDEVASLETSIQLIITNPNPIERRVKTATSLVDMNAEKLPAEYYGSVADALTDQGLFITSGSSLDTEKSIITYQHTDSFKVRYNNLPDPDSDALFEKIWDQSREGTVPIPTVSFEELGTYNRAVGEILDTNTYPEVETTEWYLYTLLREPKHVLGPAPIFVDENRYQLGKIGKWLNTLDQRNQNRIIRTLLFLTQPAYRYVAIAACEFNSFSMKPPFEIELHTGNLTLTNFLRSISKTDEIDYEFIIENKLEDANCQPVIDTAEWLGFINRDLTAGSYELSDSLNSAINKHKFVGEIYESEFDKLLSIKQGVIS